MKIKGQPHRNKKQVSPSLFICKTRYQKIKEKVYCGLLGKIMWSKNSYPVKMFVMYDQNNKSKNPKSTHGKKHLINQ
jgi:hypothetical protein